MPVPILPPAGVDFTRPDPGRFGPGSFPDTGMSRGHPAGPPQTPGVWQEFGSQIGRNPLAALGDPALQWDMIVYGAAGLLAVAGLLAILR